MLRVREAASDEVALVDPTSRLLARCFTADPWLCYIFPPQSPARIELIAQFFEPTVRAGLLYGRLFVTEPSLEGAAVYLGPGQAELFEEQMDSAGGANLREAIGSDAYQRVTRWGAVTQAMHQQDLMRKHWYLALLGVEATRRRHGVGERLLRPTLNQADADRLETYLETSEERNLHFYEGLGFAVMRQGIDAVGNFPYWTMIREPQPKAI